MYRKYKAVWGDEAEMLILERERMNSKPILQKLWRSWYQEIEPFMSEDGLNIEIGAGGGFASTYFKNLIQTDVVITPHINMCFDALAFPFKDSVLDTIVMIAVLHHLKNIDEFFNEARRVLKKGGKILMLEPYISYLSYPVWKHLHYESCNLKSLSIESNGNARIDANLAIPTILFKKQRKQFEKNYSDIKIIHENYHTILHFFVSGGYTYPSLFPNFLVPNLVKIEKVLQPLGKWLGSFMTLIIQKV
jgi:SAM-dependent methyltransferase